MALEGGSGGMYAAPTGRWEVVPLAAHMFDRKGSGAAQRPPPTKRVVLLGCTMFYLSGNGPPRAAVPHSGEIKVEA